MPIMLMEIVRLNIDSHPPAPLRLGGAARLITASRPASALCTPTGLRTTAPRAIRVGWPRPSSFNPTIPNQSLARQGEVPKITKN